MTTPAILDDYLLRDFLAGDVPASLAEVLVDHTPATTDLYLYRLCRSVVVAQGGALTASWSPEHRRALGRQLVDIDGRVELVPVQPLAYRMAEIAVSYRLSALGAEAVAAAEHLDAPLCVWAGDDGPAIRSAMAAVGAEYRLLPR